MNNDNDMVLVPREPTEAMLQAAVDAICYGPEGGFTRISGPSRTWAAMLAAAPAAAQPAEPSEPAPPSSLPSWGECALRVGNSEFIAKRVAEGGYGAEPDSLLASALHRFIYEYDDADSHRSSWFLHRLESVLKEAASAQAPALPAELTEDEIHARDWWCPTCLTSVPPEMVTCEETHYLESGGCGHPVRGERREAPALPAQDAAPPAQDERVWSMLVNEVVEQGQFYSDGDISRAQFISAVNHYANQARAALAASPQQAPASDARDALLRQAREALFWLDNAAILTKYQADNSGKTPFSDWSSACSNLEEKRMKAKTVIAAIDDAMGAKSHD